MDHAEQRSDVNVHLRGGTPLHGWNYLNAAPGSANTSASVWPLLALLRADELGFAGLRPQIERDLKWLRAAINRDGFMGYHRANDESPYGYGTLTAAEAVCLLRNKPEKSSQAAKERNKR